MKKTVIWAAVLAMVLAVSGCEKTNGDKDSSVKEKTESNAAAVESQAAIESSAESAADDTESGSDDDESKISGDKQPAYAKIGYYGAKAVTDVQLIPKDDVDISEKVNIFDRYGQHVLHSGVVGLVGAPVDVYFDKYEVDGGKLVFVYDPNELKGVRPDALMFLFYDDYNNKYVELEDGVLNTEKCSMSIDIDEPGMYMLVNKYQLYNARGAKLDDTGLEDGYDPTSAPISSTIWKMNENVGDILKLKDDDYIAKSRTKDGYGYEFYVSTPEELASAVFVNNCADPRPDSITINIVNDIDLEGYEWAPLGWSTSAFEFDFKGTIYGGHHKIKNMHISEGDPVGFIGFATNCTVGALDFENAYVNGADVGILAGYAKNSFFTDCNVQGVTDGFDAGTMIGHDNSNTIKNCTADVTVYGKQVTEYLSYTDMSAAGEETKPEKTEEIWLDEEGRPCRDEDVTERYENIDWRVRHNGKTILVRVANNETCYDWHDYHGVFYENGEYEIALTTDIDGYYVAVSNSLIITVDDNTKFRQYY